MSLIEATLNLHHLDLDHVTTSEKSYDEEPANTVIQFGQWQTVLTVTATDPDQLERFGEVMFLAARDLRVARGETDPNADLDAFPAAS